MTATVTRKVISGVHYISVTPSYVGDMLVGEADRLCIELRKQIEAARADMKPKSTGFWNGRT